MAYAIGCHRTWVSRSLLCLGVVWLWSGGLWGVEPPRAPRLEVPSDPWVELSKERESQGGEAETKEGEAKEEGGVDPAGSGAATGMAAGAPQIRMTMPNALQIPGGYIGPQTAMRHRLLDPKRGKTAGLMVDVIPSPNLHPGYQLWHLKVMRSDGMPFPADERITAKLSYSYFDAGIHTECDVELKQGSLQAEREVYVANWNRSPYWTASFSKDGVDLRGLSNDPALTGNAYYNHASRNFLMVMGRDEVLQAVANPSFLEPSLKSYDDSKYWSLSRLNELFGSNNATDCDVALCYPERFPENWLTLSTYGAVFTTRDVVIGLGEGQRVALRDFVLGGGVLNLIDTEERRGTEVLRALKLEGEWTRPKHAFVPSGLTAGELVIARTGMGMVIAGKGTSLQFTPSDTHAMDLVSEQRATFGLMRGTNDQMVADINYWNWLIPDVGKPPIWSFVIFIGLFAGIAGPAILILTMRARRAAWLLFLFPAVAFMVTLILLSYAVFYEGFRTVARARSYTLWDPAENRGFLWGRQTTFSGTSLQEGLKVPADCELSPMNFESEYQDQFLLSPRQRWGDEGQVFQRLVRTREQRQVLIRMPVRDLAPYRVEDGEVPKLTNTSSGRWICAALRRGPKEVWYAVETKPGEEASWIAVSGMDGVVSELQKKAADFNPNFPDGLVQGQQMSIMSWASRSNSVSFSGAEPLMEEEMRRVLREGPGERSVVILSTGADYFPRMADGVKYESSFHVMVGKW